MQEMDMPQAYAFITGATGGLGKAFVETLAKRGDNLILTGRSEEKLLALKNALKEQGYQQEIEIFPCDLSNEQSRKDLFSKIAEKNLYIHTLINVAGADVQKDFTQYTQEKIAFQCRVNFEAAVSACRFAIERKASHLDIVNISSVSGIYPMPYFAIYSASKAALTSFSSALREEMKGKGVHVSAILPGAMPTREDIKEQIKGQGLWGKLAVKSPQWVAEYSLKIVKKNKRVKIAGFWNKVMRIGTAFIPLPIKLRFIARRWSKIYKDAF